MTKIPASTRIRDNQRRSRARHKEYVHDLEQRIEGFEKQGVQATLEVQAAGRKVVEENKLLRSLLGLRGVADAEVEDYLQTHKARTDPVGGPLSTPPADSGVPQRATAGRLCSSGPKQTCRNGKTMPEAAAHDRSPVPLSGSKAQSLPSLKPRESGPCPDRHPLPKEGTQPPLSVPCTPQIQRASSAENRSGQATTCESAARIIAGMRHDSDMQDMRAELGCTSDASCMVDNMAIMRAMDR